MYMCPIPNGFRDRAIHCTDEQHAMSSHELHTLSGIRTHDPSVLASEDSSCLRPRGYSDRLFGICNSMKVQQPH
jgi:hypothetical protein